jgi:virulence factor Mce-like protein
VTDVIARLTAVTCAGLLVGVLAALWITSNPGTSGASLRAEFDDVYPLLPGMHVRVDGAIAGSVGEIEVTDDGQALVTIHLNEGTAPPPADASAAIRQQDITGDSYVALEPGDDPEPLGDTVIAREKTIVAPRFDDLLDGFNEPVREGLELVLVELGKGLEARGADLNRAVLELRPALGAANEALAEVHSQNHVLRELVADAESVTSQAAGRSRELGGLIDSLATALRTTAEHRPALDAALAGAPRTATDARRTLAKLADTADAAQPLARTLAASAPDLETALTTLGPFLGDARATIDAVDPTLSLLERLLAASLPTLREAPRRVLTAPLDIAAAAGAVLDSIIGDRQLQRALFSADGYGEGEKAADDVGLGAIGVEEGDQAGYSGNDPERRFLRAEAVLTCETFGLRISPGCLADALAGASGEAGGGKPESRGAAGEGDGAGPDGGAAGAPAGPTDDPGQGGGSGGSSGSGGSGAPEDDVSGALDDSLGDVEGLLDGVGGNVEQLLDDLRNGGRGGGAQEQDLDAVDDLLDFLLAP